MTVTTVKIQTSTKAILDQFKEGTQSYDDVIKKIAQGQTTQDLKKRMVEGYKSIGKKDLALLREWEHASLETGPDGD